MNPDDQNLLGDSHKPLEPSQDIAATPSFPSPPQPSSSMESSTGSSFIPPRDEKINDQFSTKDKGEDLKKNLEKESVGESGEKYDFAAYLKRNKEAVGTYVLLLIGILLLVFDAFLPGSLIIGLVAGYHFSYEIVFYLRNLTQIFAGQEQVRYIVLTAVVAALFIAIPGIFVGALVAAVFKQVIVGNREM